MTDWTTIAQLGGVPALAAFAIWILQKTWEGRLADQRTTQEELKAQRETLMGLVRANTVAMTEIVTMSRGCVAASHENLTASHELCQEVRLCIATARRSKKGNGDQQQRKQGGG